MTQIQQQSEKKKTEALGFHGPARLGEAGRNPLEKGRLALLRTPRASATELGRDPDVCRILPAGPLRAQQPKAREKTSGRRRRPCTCASKCILYLLLVHVYVSWSPGYGRDKKGKSQIKTNVAFCTCAISAQARLMTAFFRCDGRRFSENMPRQDVCISRRSARAGELP